MGVSPRPVSRQHLRNMSNESLHSSTATSFTGDVDSYLDKIGSKAPQSWRKPRSRMYDYNRTLGYEYYQPMVDYVVAKENTGVYHNRRSVHMPVDVELQQRNTESPDSLSSNTSTDLGDFLVKSYAKQIKERNSSTANVHYYLLHGSKSSTDYSKDNMLEEAKKEAVRSKLAAEEHAKHMSDPEVVSWLREGAKSAVYWCHRTPLSKEERKARLEGQKYIEPEVDLKQFYYY